MGEASDVVDERALEGIASWLRTRLGLTLFGFDVVVRIFVCHGPVSIVSQFF